MRGHPCRQLGRARRPVPTNDPGPPLKGAECSAPAAAVGVEIPLDADGAGGGKVLALATQDETMHYPIDTDRRCVHVEASQLLRGRRALHGGAQRAHVLLELCHVRRQRVGPATFLDEGDQLLQRICGRARQLVRVFHGASLLLVGSLEGLYRALPRLASPADRSRRDAPIATGPLPRTYPASGGMVAAPFVPRPLATHALPATECHMADSDEP